MSELSRMFQDRGSVTQAENHYQHNLSFAEMAFSTSVAHDIAKRVSRSELGIGLELAALDAVVFNSQPLSLDDISFLDKVSTKFNKKNRIKLK